MSDDNADQKKPNTETGAAAREKPTAKAPRPAEELLARPQRTDIPHLRDNFSPQMQGHSNNNTLLIGPGIEFRGEVQECVEMIVQGAVKARIQVKRLVVGDGGEMKGECHVDEADIAGRFDGVLNCSGKLTVRTGGELNGSLRYGDVEIQPGGRVIGDVQIYTGDENTEIRPGGGAIDL